MNAYGYVDKYFTLYRHGGSYAYHGNKGTEYSYLDFFSSETITVITML